MTEPTPLRERVRSLVGSPQAGMPAPEPREAPSEQRPQVPAPDTTQHGEELTEAQAGRESLKQRLKVEHAHAVRDLDYARIRIAETAAVIKEHETNLAALRELEKLTERRVLDAKMAMARFI